MPCSCRAMPEEDHSGCHLWVTPEDTHLISSAPPRRFSSKIRGCKRLLFLHTILSVFIVSLFVAPQTSRAHFIYPAGSYTVVVGQSFVVGVSPSGIYDDCIVAATVTVDPDLLISGGGQKTESHPTFTMNALAPGQATVTISFDGQGEECPAVRQEDLTITIVADETTGGKTAISTSNDPVNTFTGELFSNETPDFNLGGAMPLYFSRYYASYLRRSFILGDLGSNWLHNFDQKLHWNGNSISYINKTGRATHFLQDLASDVWEQQSNRDVPYQLSVILGQDVVLYDPQDYRVYTFDYTTSNLLSGKLKKIEDGKGNVHTLTYNEANGQLESVTDGMGRTLTFTYDNTMAIPKISMVSDGNRSISFLYADPIDTEYLTLFTDAMGGTTLYSYKDTSTIADHALMTSKRQPRLNIPYRQTYFDTTNQYNSGKVATQADASGNKTDFSYADGLTTMTDPQGDIREHTNTSLGDFTNLTDQADRSVSMAYDADGRRTSLTDRLGDTTSLGYHSDSGRLSSVAHADGTTSAYTYTARTVDGITYHDLTGITHADGTTESMIYDASGNMTSRTNQLGNVSAFTYNNKGQRLTSTYPAGGVTTNTFNADGTLASVTDQAGNITTFGYDSLKRPNLTTHADGSTASFTYDNADRLLTATDENGHTTTMTYDSNGNLKTYKTPLDETTTFIYDDNDRLISKTDPLEGTVTTTYDESGRVATFIDENGNVTTNGYDELGQLTTVTDPLENIWKTSYDLEGVLASRTNPLEHTMTFTSDKMGLTTRITSPLGNISRITYDAMGLISTSTDPLGNVTTMSRDATGLISGIVLNGTSISTAYTRNQLGQVLTVTDPNGNDWNRAYDNSGRLISSTDPLGNLRAVSYDDRNRISVVTFPDGMGTLTMGYDDVGNPTSRTYSDGTTLNAVYDANGRLINADGIANTYDANGRNINSNGIATSYDANGRIAAMTLTAGKAVTYAYDANDQLLSVTDWAGGITTFTYDAAGRLTAITRPNDINRTNSYDNDSRLTDITEGSAASINLTRDAGGRILTAVRTAPQVASANGQTDINNTFDAASQVATHTYDAMGRITTAGTSSFTWNLASRLTSYTKAGITTTATYDGAGFRLSRTIGSTTNNFIWGYALLVPSIMIEKQGETDFRYYIRMPGGELLYSINASTDARSFYHFDEMGNTIFVSNDAGVPIGSYAYTPYGKITSSAGELENPFTWQGEFGVMDEGDGLYYIRARYYDAASGRFISRDPIERDKPRSINPYQYVFGNPLKYSDVSGRTPKGASEAAAATTSGLSLGLKSTASAATAGGAGFIGDSINLAIHLSEDEIDTGKVAEDSAMLAVDTGGLYLTATAATAEAGAVTGASIAGPAVFIYAIARLGIVNYEMYLDLEDLEARIEVRKKVIEITNKRRAREHAEKQARMAEEIKKRHEESLQREQRFREENNAREKLGKKDDDQKRKALKFLGDLWIKRN
jgi:RHS repeat-associated protein